MKDERADIEEAKDEQVDEDEAGEEGEAEMEEMEDDVEGFEDDMYEDENLQQLYGKMMPAGINMTEEEFNNQI